VLAVELNCKNAARGWSEAATMCGLTTRNKDRTSMSKERTLVLKHNHDRRNCCQNEVKRFSTGMQSACAALGARCQVAFSSRVLLSRRDIAPGLQRKSCIKNLEKEFSHTQKNQNISNVTHCRVSTGFQFLFTYSRGTGTKHPLTTPRTLG
jgi:hypothetical protein